MEQLIDRNEYDNSMQVNPNIDNNYNNIIYMKEEHTKLVSSLTALTTHFAHVQFRLRQVIDAPLENKEVLLRDLEEFTFKGIPDFQVGSLQSNKDVYHMKDELISTLKSQISELESSIKYLQKESERNPNEDNCCNTNNTVSKVHESYDHIHSEKDKSTEAKVSSYLSFFRKLLAILHIVNVHCKEEKDNLRRDLLKKKIKINHWGDVRARLEIYIADVIELAKEPNNIPIDSDYMSDSEDSSYCNQKIASVVRKQLASTIQHLMQHGLLSDNKSITVTSGITFVIGCVPNMNANTYKKDGVHAWELILKYYSMKNGDQFISAPALKLSQSFNIDVGGSYTNSSVQKLLVTIGNIVSTHSQFKRGYNSQFKAFICAGLNAKLLANWLQLIYRSKQLIEMYYEPWSYAIKMGFDDCCKSLEKLNHIHFNLPVNTAVHELQNIKDAF